MSCSYPISAFWLGGETETGKKDYYLDFTRGDMLPVDLVERQGRHVTSCADVVDMNGRLFLVNPLRIPCGHCAQCRLTESRKWVARMVLEDQGHLEPSYFVTLTYDDFHLLSARPHQDLTNFFKRLRKLGQFRYFACFELGETTHRPHFHAILFGWEPGELDRLAPNAYHSSKLDECWPFGLHSLSYADNACLAYVAGYVQKKSTDEYARHSWRVMSRRPGLGSMAYAKARESALKGDFHVYGDFGCRHSSLLPRFYLDKLAKEFPSLVASYQDGQQRKAGAVYRNNYLKFGTDDRELIGSAMDDEALRSFRARKGV